MVTGYIVSYWNRPYFPEWCGDYQLDDPVTYDTMVRTAGSWNGFALAFRVIVQLYDWKHFVLVSDENPTRICYFGAKPLSELFQSEDNYTFYWLRLPDNPTIDEMDYLLEQIRAKTRGESFFSARHALRAIKVQFHAISWICCGDSSVLVRLMSCVFGGVLL